MIVINTWQYGKRYDNFSRLVCKFENVPSIPDLRKLNVDFHFDPQSSDPGISVTHCDEDPRLVFVDVHSDGLPFLKEFLEKLQNLDVPRWYEVLPEAIAENNARLYGIVQEFNCTRPMKWEVD